MVSMSQQIVELMETNQTLQGELGAFKEERESGMEQMREEFTKRIGMSEKKLQAIIKVRVVLHDELKLYIVDTLHWDH